MFRPFLAVCALALVSSVASAAIVYEPVQTQYRDPRYDRPMVYYGGNNPLVLHYIRNLQARYNAATDPTDVGVSFGREGRFGYDMIHPRLTTPIPYVYSDLLPIGVNAFPYGVSENDTHNEAMSHLQLYFRMADLRGHREADGSIVVPAIQPRGYIDIHPMHAATTQPATEASAPQPILIIPKSLLKKKLNSPTDPVARAN